MDDDAGSRRAVYQAGGYVRIDAQTTGEMAALIAEQAAEIDGLTARLARVEKERDNLNADFGVELRRKHVVEAQVKALERALRIINSNASPDPHRTWDGAIRALDYITDTARAVLAGVDGRV
jgi:hypothetical protein